LLSAANHLITPSKFIDSLYKLLSDLFKLWSTSFSEVAHHKALVLIVLVKLSHSLNLHLMAKRCCAEEEVVQAYVPGFCQEIAFYGSRI